MEREVADSVAIDSKGHAFIAGTTDSDEKTFPVRVGPDLTFNQGSQDAFVAKVASDGSRLVYCGYIGGDSYDIATGVDVDTRGNAYATGETGSSPSTFPVKVGPSLTRNGYTDAFVARVNTTGSLDYCGYIGGARFDRGNAVVVDSAGRAHVVGKTDSDEKSFPVKVGPGLTHGGNDDAFVARVDSRGGTLDYCGYIGGTGVDEALDVALHNGQLVVAGMSGSALEVPREAGAGSDAQRFGAMRSSARSARPEPGLRIAASSAAVPSRPAPESEWIAPETSTWAGPRNPTSRPSR